MPAPRNYPAELRDHRAVRLVFEIREEPERSGAPSANPRAAGQDSRLTSAGECRELEKENKELAEIRECTAMWNENVAAYDDASRTTGLSPGP